MRKVSCLVPVARNLRHCSTEAERLVWKHLRNRRLDCFKFRRQVPIGKYIVDFASFESKLIVELDGSQHAETEHAVNDRKRDEWLARQGFKVLRFWNGEVVRNTEAVLRIILEECRRTLTKTSPIKGEASGKTII